MFIGQSFRLHSILQIIGICLVRVPSPVFHPLSSGIRLIQCLVKCLDRGSAPEEHNRVQYIRFYQQTEYVSWNIRRARSNSRFVSSSGVATRVMGGSGPPTYVQKTSGVASPKKVGGSEPCFFAGEQ